MQHHTLEALRRGHFPFGSVYIGVNGPCYPLGDEPATSVPCRCQLHFGYEGEEWVLSHNGKGSWSATKYNDGKYDSARIDLPDLGNDPDVVGPAVHKWLPGTRQVPLEGR